MIKSEIKSAINDIEEILIKYNIPRGSVYLSIKEHNALSKDDNVTKAKSEIGELTGPINALSCRICCENGMCGICCSF